MPAHRLQQGGVARDSAQFRPRNLVHGFNQRRKPRPFAISGTPLPGLLHHRLCLARPPPGPVPVPTRSPKSGSRTPAEKNRQNVMRVTNHLLPPVLNRPHDSEIAAIHAPHLSRSSRRLRPDCRQRHRRVDCADLSHPELTESEAGRRMANHPLVWSAADRERFSCYRAVGTGSPDAGAPGPKIRQAQIPALNRFVSRHCVNRA